MITTLRTIPLASRFGTVTARAMGPKTFSAEASSRHPLALFGIEHDVAAQGEGFLSRVDARSALNGPVAPSRAFGPRLIV